MAPTLGKALTWIAMNDEPGMTDPAEVRDQVTANLIAEIFDAA